MFQKIAVGFLFLFFLFQKNFFCFQKLLDEEETYTKNNARTIKHKISKTMVKKYWKIKEKTNKNYKDLGKYAFLS